eukprot:gene4172-14272_t
MATSALMRLDPLRLSLFLGLQQSSIHSASLISSSSSCTTTTSSSVTPQHDSASSFAAGAHACQRQSTRAHASKSSLTSWWDSVGLGSIWNPGATLFPDMHDPKEATAVATFKTYGRVMEMYYKRQELK